MTPWHAPRPRGADRRDDARLRLRPRRRRRRRRRGGACLLRFTLVGYVLALAISLYALWTFGRIDGVGGAAAADGDARPRLPGRPRRRRGAADPLMRGGSRGRRAPRVGARRRCGAWWWRRSSATSSGRGWTPGRTPPRLVGRRRQPAPPGEVRFAVRNDGGRTATAVAAVAARSDDGTERRACRSTTCPGTPRRPAAFVLVAEGSRRTRASIVVEGYLDP